MKFFYCALILLSASYGAAQAVSSHQTPAMPPAGMAPAQSKAAPMAPPPTVTIAPDAAVITVMHRNAISSLPRMVTRRARWRCCAPSATGLSC